MRITFPELKMRGVRYWKENGKRRQETRVFMQTVNPFNKNADGVSKTHDEIYAELRKERDEWLSSFTPVGEQK